MSQTVSTSAPAPTAHARLSPSSSSRWLQCPYSATVELPEQEISEASAEGTEAHGWAANVLAGNCDLDSVPPAYYDGVAMYVSHIVANGCKNPPIVEKQWRSMEIDNFFGTVDCLLIENGKAAIYDFKYGKWDVPVIDNPQLLCYAVIVSEHFDINQFWGAIIQPNTNGKQQIKVATYSLDQVEAHREWVREAANSDAKNPGFKQCMFCPLLKAGVCEEGVTYARNSPLRNFKHLQDVPGL